MTETQWMPTLVAAALGGVAGLGFVFAARSGERLPDPLVAQREDLERQKETLYESIRQARQDNEEAELLRLELEAVHVVATLDKLAPTPSPPSPRTPTVSSRYPQLTGAFWGGLVMLFFGLLWSGLQNHSAPRSTGGSMTGGSGTGAGSSTGSGPALSPEDEAELAALESAAKANPTDAAAQNAYAHALIRINKLMEAWQISELVVAFDDQNAEARAHQGIVLMAIGELEMSKGVLEKVLEVRPDMAEALAYRGLLYYREQDFSKAVEVWERAIKADPSQEKLLNPLVEIARDPARAAAFMAQQSGGRSASGNTSASSAGASLQGEIKIPAALAAAVKPKTVLFLSARPVGVTRGPPLAARKLTLEPGQISVPFTLGPEDSPMGGTLAGELVITARTDSDGDPVSRSPEDLEGQSPTVTPGGASITIELAHNPQ